MKFPLGLSAGELIFALAIVAILAMALFFLACRNYEEGMVGNVVLSLCIAVPCGLVLWDVWRGLLKLPAPSYCLLIVGLAVFMLRHGYRFAMFHWAGLFGWRPPRNRPALRVAR